MMRMMSRKATRNTRLPVWKAPKIKPSRNLIASTSPAPPCVAVCRTENAGSLECVRLLAQAGANVNAHDNEGNTPLHETFLTDVEEELLKLGEDVNARNKDGETPIFTTVDNDAIPLFIEHGADLSIRNNKCETVMETAKEKGPFGEELSARQCKVRTSVSSRLRGIADPSHGRRAWS